MAQIQIKENSKGKKTGINFACECRSAPDVARMIRLGCDVHETDNFGNPAIIIAALKNSTACVKLLLDAGVSADTTSPTGESIADYARFHGNTQMLALVGENADIKAGSQPPNLK